MKKIFLGIILVALSLSSLFFWRANFSPKEKQATLEDIENQKVLQDVVAQKQESIAVPGEKTQQIPPAKIVKVPFTSQAPLGNWSDERNQNGCEEASILMAMKWIRGESFSSPSDVQKEIFEIAKFEEKTFGNSVDASVEEVGEIFSQYYGHKNFAISRNVTLDVLKSELEKGNLILVPAFGRALKNPNYTQPGPITHMLLLVGYDAQTKEFITNDPGTKRGEGYRYNENILLNAIWAYPAGKNHPQPPKSITQKAMLTIGRN